jgi:hypothetical protein
MAERIIDGTQFNVNDIMYTTPKATPQGAKSVNILNKKTKTGLTLSTPLMLTWGAAEFVDQASGVGDGKFTLSLQFPGKEYENDETTAFLKNMKALEDKIKADALIYSKEWFGKVHKSADVVDALWTPMLKYSKDKVTGDYDLSRPPTLRIKLPQWEGVFKCEIYSEDGDKLFPNPLASPLEYLKKGSNIMTLIQFAGIWFVNGKFSASWKLIQAVVQKPKATLQGQCFIKMKTQDKEKLKNQEVIEDGLDDNLASTIVDDSDNEDAAPPVTVFNTPPPTPVVEKVVVEEPVVQAPVVQEEPKKVVKKVVKKKTDSA